MLFWPCDGITPGVPWCFECCKSKGLLSFGVGVGSGDEDLCRRAHDLRHCLASAALVPGRINAFPSKGEENCCFAFHKGAWRDELPEAAPEACDGAGNPCRALNSRQKT